ncbi:MAG TPA: hypothetical protein VMK30_00290 [Pleomorphomonadaceae bacterium]|nr:hypothetical protein [Pleomorphomonadaceae bacterium]
MPESEPEPRLINLTVRVDDYVVLHARWRALREGTSVNAAIAEFLSAYSGVATRIRHSRPPRAPRPRDIYEEGLRRSRAGY